jgi:hypothetical protein
VCGARRGRLVPLALVGIVPLLAAPAYARELVLQRVALAGTTKPPRGWHADGFPPPVRQRHPARRFAEVVVAAVIAFTVLIAGATELADLTRDERLVANETRAGVASASQTTAPAPGPGSSAPIGATTSPSGAVGSSIGAPGSTSPTPSNGPASSAPLTPAPPPTTPPPPVITNISTTPKVLGTLGCPDSIFEVVASVTGAEPLTVDLVYVDPAGAKSIVSMTLATDVWVAKIGPFADPGTLMFSVTATDALGRSVGSPAASVAVVKC